MSLEGRWVYGMDFNFGGLPVYSEEQFASPGDAIRASIQKFGLDTYRFRLVVGKLSRPAPPAINGPKLLVHLFTERYTSTTDAVLYQPGIEDVRWKDSDRMGQLEENINKVFQEWFAEPEHNLGWYEIVDEQEVSNEDIIEAVNELREARA